MTTGTQDAGTAEAIAHPNIALAKYWGKREDGERLPSVPSLSVTLLGMRTRTRVRFDAALSADELVLAGAAASAQATARVSALLDRVRGASGRHEKARVESDNDFPTASGLASSASAFAALAAAATAAAGLTYSEASMSDLARRSSVSAARSVLGGFVELPAGCAGDVALAAVSVAPPDHFPLRIVVAITREGPKDVGSTEGMLHTTRTSPFYPAWVAHAPSLCARVRAAVLARDLEALGAAAEQSALCMHASALAAAPGLIYWTGATVEAIAEVRRLRARGLAAWATIDAGPQVKVLTTPGDEEAVTRALSAVPGVLRTIATRPGPGATVLSARGA